jgi:hypothetical protein
MARKKQTKAKPMRSARPSQFPDGYGSRHSGYGVGGGGVYTKRRTVETLIDDILEPAKGAKLTESEAKTLAHCQRPLAWLAPLLRQDLSGKLFVLTAHQLLQIIGGTYVTGVLTGRSDSAELVSQVERLENVRAYRWAKQRQLVDDAIKAVREAEAGDGPYNAVTFLSKVNTLIKRGKGEAISGRTLRRHKAKSANQI